VASYACRVQAGKRGCYCASFRDHAVGHTICCCGGVLLVIAVLYSLIVEVGGGPETFSETALTPSYAITTGMSLLAAVLILFGLVGLNLRQSEAAGALGRVGFLVAFLGTALVVGTVWTEFFVAPSLALEAPEFLDAEEIPGLLDVGFISTYTLLSLGWALFGMAALRARIYPRWVPISAHNRRTYWARAL
jgi:hypothetical protein